MIALRGARFRWSHGNGTSTSRQPCTVGEVKPQLRLSANDRDRGARIKSEPWERGIQRVGPVYSIHFLSLGEDVNESLFRGRR